MTDFEPVFLPDENALNGAVSQTFLRAYNQCPRSALLYQRHKGTHQHANMVRGSAVHKILERAIRVQCELGEPIIPGELVKAIATEVFAEMHVPLEEHDLIREMVYRWAQNTVLEPDGVIANETMFYLNLGGYTIRCKIDHAETRDRDRVCYVVDYKSSRSAPAYEEVARKRPDGTLAAKNFQLILYALVLAYGYSDDSSLPECSRAQRFDLEFAYPAIKIDDANRMLRRRMTLTRLELEEYRASFEALLTRVARSEQTGDWPAIVSDQACGECTAPLECPIRASLRGVPTEITTVAGAAWAASLLDREAEKGRKLRAEIKRFCEKHDLTLRFGAKVFEFVPTTTERVDREALEAAIYHAQQGEPVDPADYLKVSHGTRWKSRDLTADELLEQTLMPAGSDAEETPSTSSTLSEAPTQ